MAVHIPFLTSKESVSLARKLYSDSKIFRLSLQQASVIEQLPNKWKIWLDPCVDGMDDLVLRSGTADKPNAWYQFMCNFKNFEDVGSPSSHSKPVVADVSAFVTELMDACAAHEPAWITVPQLPITAGSGRNKINRAMAKAVGLWKVESEFAGRLILPLVFTHQNQVIKKTIRKSKIDQAEKCYQDSQANGTWVVDSSLQDERGSGTLQLRRFPAIINLHEELNDRLAPTIRIAGPYWGLNLVLWARGLVDYPLIGVGGGYQFFLSGGFARTAATRIALPSLRRRAQVGPQLQKWLESAISKIGRTSPAYAEFQDIKNRLASLQDDARARAQVAEFYKKWFDAIAVAPKTGRSLALYQDLSAAYALGKSLPSLLAEATARRPESIAEPLMLNCL